MTQVEAQTREYWRASFVIRQNRGDAREQFAARLILPRLVETGETEAIKRAARLVCLGYGIVACGFTLHSGGAA